MDWDTKMFNRAIVSAALVLAALVIVATFT